jgi:hypothetical protein
LKGSQTELHIKNHLFPCIQLQVLAWLYWSFFTLQRQVCIDAYIPILMMLCLLHICPLWIFVITVGRYSRPIFKPNFLPYIQKQKWLFNKQLCLTASYQLILGQSNMSSTTYILLIIIFKECVKSDCTWMRWRRITLPAASFPWMLAMSFTLGMPRLDFDAVLISKTHSLRSEREQSC